MTIPRRPNKTVQDKLTIKLDLVAAVAATTTFPLQTMDGDFYVEKFEIEAPGGYVADPANYYVIALKDGATTLAQWSTQTGQEGALTTLVFGVATLQAVIAGAKGDRLDIVFTKNGTAVNFPAQARLVVHAKQL